MVSDYLGEYQPDPKCFLPNVSLQGVGKGPYMDAFAEFHDGLHDYSFIPDDQVSLILTMPPSYAVTIVAAAQPYSSYYHLTLNNQGDY
jgi:hypothetical protein